MRFNQKMIFSIFLISIITLNIIFPSIAFAADTNNGAKIFASNCAGCHINGGNIVRRAKNLKMRALKKYGMDSVDAIASIVANGENNMSAYQDCLTKQEIQDVATYTLRQAQQNWR